MKNDMIPIPAIIIIASGVLICAYLIIKMWANENKTDLVEMEENKMTENEAIKILEYIKSNLNDSQMFARHDEALDMAIKALEQQPCEDCISREAVDVLIDELARAISDERCFISRGRSTANIMQDILDLSSVTPTVSDDCISRKEVIDIINFEDKWLFDAKSHNADTKIAFSGLNSRVKDLPSVQSTRPTGRWIDIQYFKADDTYYRPKCPFCSTEPKEYSNYCPNCGARMAESEDKE